VSPNSVALFTVLLSGVVSASASYVAARFSARRQQRHATDSYKLALISEIRALHKRLVRYDSAFNNRVLTSEMSGAHLLKVLLQPGDMLVFTNNASAIGLFDSRTALRVLRFYSDVRTIHGHALVLSEIAVDTGSPPSKHAIRFHQSMLRHARRRAHLLVRRLKRPSLGVVTLSRLRRR
jgi:hypothetical protein